jgi:hypothetical protein
MHTSKFILDHIALHTSIYIAIEEEGGERMEDPDLAGGARGTASSERAHPGPMQEEGGERRQEKIGRRE